MRLSREKMVHLSHIVVKAIEDKEKVELLKGSNDVRLGILQAMQRFMKLDEKIEQDVRSKIESTKKDIPEGSREWDVQFRKYFEEEWDKVRKVKD
ncbi:DUF507 family protein [Acidobacteriota bacterium]